MRFWRLIIALLLVLGLSPAAQANGRFPESLRLFEFRNNPDKLVLTGTFGMLVTDDRGKNWHYVCEKAFAGAFIEGDPLIEVLPDGTMLSGIYETLNISRDCACGWQPVLAESPQEVVWDITVDKAAPQNVLALVIDSTTVPFRSRIHESSDSGRTWRKLSDLPANVFNVFTIDIAPSDSSRIYVTGVSRPESGPDRGVLLVSRNHGMTWEEIPIPGTDSTYQPYIAAVLPTNPDALFVRTDEWLDGVDPSANDALLYSTDAGRTWKEVFRKGGKLFGFALSPDLSSVVIGLGDPLAAGGRSTEEADLGIYKASLSNLTFEKIYSGMISCLSWTSSGLYVCHAEYGPAKHPSEDFALGFAPNANFNLTTPNPLSVLLNLRNVRGPLGCLTSVCSGSWSVGEQGNPPTCERFAASCTVPTTDAGFACSVGDGGTTPADASDAQPDARIGDVSTGGAGGAAGSGAAGTSAGGGTTSGAGDSCSCRMGATSRMRTGYALVLLGIASSLRRRRITRGCV